MPARRLQAARTRLKQLPHLTDVCASHESHHHYAQADPKTAGRVLLAVMKHVNAKTTDELMQQLALCWNVYANGISLVSPIQLARKMTCAKS